MWCVVLEFWGIRMVSTRMNSISHFHNNWAFWGREVVLCLVLFFHMFFFFFELRMCLFSNLKRKKKGMCLFNCYWIIVTIFVFKVWFGQKLFPSILGPGF